MTSITVAVGPAKHVFELGTVDPNHRSSGVGDYRDEPLLRHATSSAGE
jgi:hypothetical protein